MREGRYLRLSKDGDKVKGYDPECPEEGSVELTPAQVLDICRERIEHLNGQVATLTQACVLKDVRVGKALEKWAKETESLAADGPLPRSSLLLQVLAAVIAKAKESTDQQSPDALLPSIDHMAGIAPGLKTITEVAEEYERVGRAVVEWQKREAAAQEVIGEPVGPYTNGWRRAICSLGRTIDRAKAGEEP